MSQVGSRDVSVTLSLAEFNLAKSIATAPCMTIAELLKVDRNWVGMTMSPRITKLSKVCSTHIIMTTTKLLKEYSNHMTDN